MHPLRDLPRFTTMLAALLAGLSLGGAAQAALVDRGGGMIYDDVLNITWLQDANYARTSRYDIDGLMHWDAATTWAANLVYGGYDDWRLPTMIDTGRPGCNAPGDPADCGYYVQTWEQGPPATTYSELAYMYYVNLGLKGFISADGTTTQPDYGIYGNGTFGGQNDVGLIRNLQSYVYWSGLEFEPSDPSPSLSAWIFATKDGFQNLTGKPSLYYAWAVRNGDVTGANNNPVPEPQTLALVGLGLLGMAGARRRG